MTVGIVQRRDLYIPIVPTPKIRGAEEQVNIYKGDVIGSEFITAGGYNVRPIDLFDGEYYSATPFTPLTISQLQTISGDEMLGESNIYVDLSTIGNSSITLSYDNLDLTDEILY